MAIEEISNSGKRVEVFGLWEGTRTKYVPVFYEAREEPRVETAETVLPPLLPAHVSIPSHGLTHVDLPWTQNIGHPLS